MYETLWLIFTLVALTVVTLVTRCFFFLSEREPALPGWVKRGLRYAPLAALSAVIAPEVLLTQGQLVDRWTDPRLAAVAVATLWYLLRRGVFGTIMSGMATLLALRLGLGW